MAKKKTSPALTANKADDFEPGDYVLVVHDNDPKYIGARGIVYAVDEFVHVALFVLGELEKRSYLPVQLKNESP